MLIDPSLIYSTPAKFISAVTYTQTVSIDQEKGHFVPFTLNLNSLPSGMLEAITVTVKPAAPLVNPPYGDHYTAPNYYNVQQGGPYTVPFPQYLQLEGFEGRGLTTPKFVGSLPLEKIKLTFGGQNLLRFDTENEIRHFMRTALGDDMRVDTLVYSNRVHPWSTSYYSYVEGPPVSFLEHSRLQFRSVFPCKENFYLLPMVNNVKEVFQQRLNENVPSYGGAQLQLELTVGRHLPMSQSADWIPACSATAGSYRQTNGGLNEVEVTADMSAGDDIASNLKTLEYLPSDCDQIEITIGYILSANLEVSQGAADLQL